MKRICVLAACVLCLSQWFSAFGQSPASPAPTKTKYDQTSQIKINGVVDEIQQRSPGGTCKAPEVVLILKADGQNFELHVGPKWFVDELTWTFTKGDKLEVTGWKVNKEGSNEVVVRKISRAEWNLEPRDDSGAANWLWMAAAKDSGKCT